MILTDKALGQFKEWLKIFENTSIHDHERLEDNQKFGVLVDWFDSVGIDIDEIYSGCEFEIAYREQNNIGIRQEARAKAIEKANEIYNK